MDNYTEHINLDSSITIEEEILDLSTPLSYSHWVMILKYYRDPDYYDNLLFYSPQILQDLQRFKAQLVADKLQMHYTKLTVVKQLLMAYQRTTLIAPQSIEQSI